jgi:hypothetical protein
MYSSLKVALVCAGLAPIAGCTPLQKALKEIAPEYQVKRPADGVHYIGHKLKDGQAEANRCFEGDLRAQLNHSWSKVSLEYKAKAGGDIQADFGNGIVGVTVGASGSRSFKVLLEELGVQDVNGLYIDPKGNCIQDEATRAALLALNGRPVEVITRALYAESVSVSEDSSGGGNVAVNLANLKIKDVPVKIGPKITAEGETVAGFKGARLFIGYLLQKVRVTSQRGECVIGHGAGEACELGSCRVVLGGMGNENNPVYSATLSCEGGASYELPQKPYGQWTGERVAPGVSYSVAVSPAPPPAGTGMYKVEVTKWVVN